MATLTTLVSFDETTNGGEPLGGLTIDAAGDLFGTTSDGGPALGGTVFELVDTGGAYSLKTLFSLSTTSPSPFFPEGGVVVDSNGNLFATAFAGGAETQWGAVFELTPSGPAYTSQTLISFDFATTGATPAGSLLADAGGDLFGTTESGPGGFGTVFELVKGASGFTFQSLVVFSGLNGETPLGGLVADADGDLFGTTELGGASGFGTVFELVKSGSSYSLQTLVSFAAPNGLEPGPGNLAIDAHGDLFGETVFGGNATSDGTVFELVKTGAGYTFQTLYEFSGTDGARPQGGLIVDANGDLFGETKIGGSGVTSPAGTVFELVNTGAGYTLSTLATFDASGGEPNGVTPVGGLTVDANGDLFGETETGGPGQHGTVFEITGSGFVTTPADDDSAEQAALQLSVNGGSTTPIGAAGVQAVAFTIAGLDPEDTGTVTFTDSANHMVVVDVTAGQSAYSADLSSLIDGAITASLQVATDGSDNSFLPVAGNGVTLDTMPPLAPTGLADAAIVGGHVDQAHDTPSQTLTGHAEAGALVTVYDNGNELGTASADPTTGDWSYQLGILGGGPQSLTATATDAAGNTGPASDALAFTVDLAAPIPAVTDVITSPVTHLTTITGTSEAGSTVRVFDGAKQIGVATADAQGLWSLSLNLNASSIHQFTETALDAAGDTGSSTGVAFYTNAANNKLVGGSGDDVLVGRPGDILTGGGGEDHFVFNPNFGKETITDFAPGTGDQIWFDQSLFGSFASVMAHAKLSGGNTVITFDGGDTLTLKGVLPGALSSHDFMFF